MGKLVGVVLVTLLLAACESQPREGSGSPFESGSIEASVEGSNDLSVSQVVRDPSGAFRGTITYSGSCPRVRAELRFSYKRGDTTVTAQEIDGIDEHFELELGPNESDSNSYSGEEKFTPDAIVFVISNERCA
jgi:hypothetical protein